jgi:hypothetical protein
MGNWVMVFERQSVLHFGFFACMARCYWRKEWEGTASFVFERERLLVDGPSLFNICYIETSIHMASTSLISRMDMNKRKHFCTLAEVCVFVVGEIYLSVCGLLHRLIHDS